ncbi:AEC family transporter [Leisingera sp. ANG59]|uniref:AEC family transporter n=1 Tax=Leisingera sp. ANG59 TaxID=2675221 RepID=UPI0015735FEE|nr:AEC family transporter [Leisingera sp. ANG59]NSY40392.1 AEC family transporter [Leisingera sp. ANG59]
MPPVFLALLPDFLLLITGGLLRRTLPAPGRQGIDKLNFCLLFPALIFVSALRSPPSTVDLTVMGLGVWAGMVFACALAWGLRGLGPSNLLDFAGMWQTVWRFNTAIAIVAAQALPAEYRGLMSIAIGLAVPVANIMAISALSRGHEVSWKKTLHQVMTNPFLIASVVGVTLSVLKIHLPDTVMTALTKLAQAAVPVALLSIGASVNWHALAQMDRFEVALNAIKLIVLPGATFLGATLLGVGPGPRMVLTIFAALPTASAAHVLASVYGADRERVATLIAQSTLLSCITLPCWLMMLV